MATLEQAADALMGLIRANIPAIKTAPDKPPDNASLFPFAATWPGRGRITEHSPGTSKHVATLILEIHVARKDLQRAVDAVFPFVDDVRRLLVDTANVRLPDAAALPTVDTLLLSDRTGGITWTFAELDWADVKTLGWRFEIQLKQTEVIP